MTSLACNHLSTTAKGPILVFNVALLSNPGYSSQYCTCDANHDHGNPNQDDYACKHLLYLLLATTSLVVNTLKT